MDPFSSLAKATDWEKVLYTVMITVMIKFTNECPITVTTLAYPMKCKTTLAWNLEHNDHSARHQSQNVHEVAYYGARS